MGWDWITPQSPARLTFDNCLRAWATNSPLRNLISGDSLSKMAYTDTFTGTNGTELSAYNANWVDAGDGVNMQINNNTVETTGGAFHGYYYNQTFASKHYGKLTIKGGRFIGPAIRMAAGANYYYCFGSVSSNSYPGQVVAGSATDWDSGQAQVN